MKDKLSMLFFLPLILILAGKIGNWIFDFNEDINSMIDSLMFVFIGIAYLIAGFSMDSKLSKAIIISCGAYLILMNFIADFEAKSYIGIVAIVIPIFMEKLKPKIKEKNQQA